MNHGSTLWHEAPPEDTMGKQENHRWNETRLACDLQPYSARKNKRIIKQLLKNVELA